ncbi:MAG: DUF4336 domain-containing protein [Myxococcales bacterium]
MSEIREPSPEPVVFDFAQKLPGGFHFPARMTVLPLSAGKLALVSPIPIDDGMARAIAALGEVELLIAPNLMHHLYLADAMSRYPRARVVAPPGLASKRTDLRIDHTLDRELPELAAAVDVIRLEGAPRMDEFVFFHRQSSTLVVTDLVFNIERPRGLMAHIVLFAMGCHGRLAASRAWGSLVKDRELARQSVERIVALPTRVLVMAHGEVIARDAQERLAEALARRFGGRVRLALPAPG